MGQHIPVILSMDIKQQGKSMLPDHIVERLPDPPVIAVPRSKRTMRLWCCGRVAATVSVQLGAVKLTGH
jgi:hypothetical protein